MPLVIPVRSPPPPPTVPTGLVASTVSSSQIDLSWNASSDLAGPGIKDYGVFQQGRGLLGFVVGTTYNHTGLTPSTSYTYFVTARDTNLLQSSASATATATTSYSGGLPFTPNANFSVSGTMADGGVLTITDLAGRLGNKSPALPAYFYDYAQGVLTQNPTYSRNSDSPPFQGCIFTSVGAGIPVNALGACQTLMDVSTNVAGPKVRLLPDPNTAASLKMYRCVKKFYSWTPGLATGNKTNLKCFRWWSGSDSGGSTNNGWINDNCDPSGGTIAFQDTLNSQFFGGSPPQANTPYTVEIEFQNSSANGVQDGIWRYVRDGVMLADPSHRFVTATSGIPGMLTFSVMDQISNNAEPAGAKLWTQADYSDDSWARIVWSPEAAWQNTTSGSPVKRELCIPTSWATTGGISTIGCFNRLGSNANLAGLYLYVLDANATAYQIGRHT
jgi:hypothetical protein